MEILFEKNTVTACRELFKRTETLQRRFEFVVPDVNADIGKICSAEAQLCLKGKEITSRGISLAIGADICVLYINEERDGLAYINTTRDFDIDIEELQDCEADIHVRLFCRGVQARAVNPRKIAVDISAEAEISCYATEEHCRSVLPGGVQPEGLQLHENTEEEIVVIQSAEKTFTVSDQISIPRMISSSDRALLVRAEMHPSDTQMIGSKAIIKGTADVGVTLCGENSQFPKVIKQSIPFSVLVDCDSEECEIGDIILQPTAVYADVMESVNDEKSLDLEIHGTAQLTYIKKCRIDFISDAYSTRCPVRCETESTSIRTGRKEQTIETAVKDTITAETENAEIVLCGAELLQFGVKDGIVHAAAAVNAVMRDPDGFITSSQKMVHFETELPEEGYEISDAYLKTSEFAQTDEGVSVAFKAVFLCAKYEFRDIIFVSSAQLDEEKAYDLSQLPTLTIVERTAGDIWKLAKEYNSSPSAIEKLDEELSHPDKLLLIPRV